MKDLGSLLKIEKCLDISLVEHRGPQTVHSIRQIKNNGIHVAGERYTKGNVAHEAKAEYVTDVHTTFWRLLWSITERTHNNMEC